jgi:hypothetical protein
MLGLTKTSDPKNFSNISMTIDLNCSFLNLLVDSVPLGR